MREVAVIFDLIVGAAIALVFSLIACRALIGSPIVDLPNEARKLHRAPTPTSGGIGIALGFALGLMALSLFSHEWRHEITTEGAAMSSIASAFAYGFLMLGFIDDAHPLGPRLKFIVFSALAIGAALGVGVVHTLPLGGATIELGFLFALAGTALWVFTLVNCVNFMDGANGLAMGSVAVGLFALAAIGVALEAPSGAGMAACGVGALIGFLYWNFPNGRLFAGDSGALFAGAIAALASLVIIQRTDLSPLVPPILFFPLLADALLTLAWRASRRRSLLDGHAEHLYQIAQRAGWGRRRIAVYYWAAMGACGLIGFAAAHMPNTSAPVLALGALSIAAVVISTLARRAAVKAGIAEI
jgi:UDP-N-acetylmuramyl pentapeptide phosphotransferase/UDP-N-acetylglucosamine-1-phosphate transferase